MSRILHVIFLFMHTAIQMKKSRVCLNAPRSIILKILGNSSSSYKPPSVKKTLQLKDVLVTGSARRKELKEKQVIKDEKAKKKSRKR